MTDRDLITTIEYKAPPERVLLSPSFTPPREGPTYQVIGTYKNVTPALLAAAASQYVAVDFETKGNDYSDESFEIVGIGLAWDTGSIYFEWHSLFLNKQKDIIQLLLAHPGLLAHNAYFDGGVIRSRMGQHALGLTCTLALYMFLSNEGWAGQKWGLKDAQKDILLWQETNEKELDEWLCLNGYYKGNRLADDTAVNRSSRFLEGRLRPDKANMWRAPVPILGKYCCLDAEACYLLFTEHLLPCLQRFPGLERFMTSFMHLIRVSIDQKLHGILMDRDALLSRREELSSEISYQTQQLLAHPLLEAPVRAIESSLLAGLAAMEPPRYRKQKERPPEPPRFLKDGLTPSKNWINWVSNGPKYSEKVLSLNWVNWRERWEKAVRGEDPAYLFNLQSNVHLTETLYNHLGYEPRVFTESGAPGTGIKALKHMGEIGKALIERAWLEKEQGFLTDYIERTESRPTIHPSFRLPGTKTGRLSSKEPNLQQVPKTKVMMGMFLARPGHILVDLDFSALEPVVATEFSQDPNMLLIYGDGRPANDVYLFVGAHIPGMREKILSTGYDPYNPTKETLARAKKECKHERGICKTVVLACQYGAGVDKVMSTLENDDVFLPREDVQQIHSGYWDLFREVKQFGWDLLRQWKRNGGWVLNGMGRPMCVTEDYKHDLLNRFIQSTGHDILVRYVEILTQALNGRNIEWHPWVIDWHDAAAIECREEDRERVVECYMDSLDCLNEELAGTIKLKGTPSWGYSMAAIKEPEE